MLLAIDVGNTNTVFAVYKGEEMVAKWRCQTIAQRCAEEYEAYLYPLFQSRNLAFNQVTEIVISSVVPNANRAIRQLCEDVFKCLHLMVGEDDLYLGIDVALDRPQEAGADRLVNAVAVTNYYEAPAIVIDFGTATTFDVIDQPGRYAGGVIAPGVNLSIEALRQAAAQLPKISVRQPKTVKGTNTVDAMRSGIYYGYVGLIEGILKRLSDEMGAKPYVIATGGLAPLFASSIPAIDTVDDSLTLKGLYQIYKQNSVSAAA